MYLLCLIYFAYGETTSTQNTRIRLRKQYLERVQLAWREGEVRSTMPCYENSKKWPTFRKKCPDLFIYARNAETPSILKFLI